MKLYIVSSLILLILTFIYLLIYSQNIQKESFTGGPVTCKDCNERGKQGAGKCLACNNCGWCVDANGYGSCVLGDYTGPYFADCSQYMFTGGISLIGNQPGKSSGSYATLITPWTGNSSGGYVNPSPPYIGNTFYGVDSPLRSARRWRPKGGTRIVENLQVKRCKSK